MDLLPSPDQVEIVSSIAEVLRERIPLEQVRKHVPGSDHDASWSQLAELGVFGLGIEDSHGGVGLGLAEEILVFRELGRALTPGPVLGTVLGAHVAAAAGRGELAEQIASGSVRVALAEPFRDASAVAGRTVSGIFRALDAAGADLIVVVTPSGSVLLDATRIDVQGVQSMDPTVGVGTFRATDAPAVLTSPTESTWWHGTALVSAQLTGIAEATRDASAGYAKIREQYGKPIGMFQAVKHRCADMALRAESAYFQTVYGALAWESGDASGTYHLSSARVVATAAARTNAADNIVNHGAMGFSDETDAHLYARRSIVLETSVGDERWHLESIGRTPTADW